MAVGHEVPAGVLAEATDLRLDPLSVAVESRLTFHRRPRIVPASGSQGEAPW